MSAYQGCKITIAVPAAYPDSTKLTKGLSAKLPGVTVEIVVHAGAKKPSVDGVFFPHGHALSGAAAQEKPGAPMKPVGGDALHGLASAALDEILAAKNA